MACKYYYKGKELSYEEFAELLQNGLLQETLKRIEAGKPSLSGAEGGVEMVGLSKANMRKLAETVGLPEPERRGIITDEELDAMAEDAIQRGYDAKAVVKKALEPNTDYRMNALDIRILTKRLGDLKAKYNSNPTDAVLQEIRDLKQAARYESEKTGRQLREFGLMQEVQADSRFDFHEGTMQAANAAKLTEEQRKQADYYYEQYTKANQRAEELSKEVENLRLQVEAEKKLREAAKTAKRAPKTKDQFKQERKEILASIKDKWNKASKGDGTLTAVPVPYAKQLAAIAPDVAKLVASYIEEGYTTLEQVAKRLKEDIKEAGIEEVTDTDVKALIAGDYNEKKPKRSELAAKVSLLRQEAKLLAELEKLEAGDYESLPEKKKKETNQRIKELRDKIDDVRKRNGLGKYSVEEKAESMLKQRIAAAEREIQKYEEKIKKGDFEKDTPFRLPDNELQQANPELYKKWKESLAKKEDVIFEFEKYKFKEAAKAESNKAKKFFDFIRAGFATFQNIKAGIDFSVIFQQAFIPSVSNPKKALKAVKAASAFFKSKEEFEQAMAVMHNSPFWSLIKDSDLTVFEPRSLEDRLRDDVFQGNRSWINKDVKINGKSFNLGDMTTMRFERFVTGYTNTMRLLLFFERANKLIDEGKTFQTHPEEFKSAARVANELTGVGKLPKGIQQATPYITPIIWSPKMLASTLNVLGLGDIGGAFIGRKGFYSSLTRSEQKFAAKQIGTFVATMMGIALSGVLIGAFDEVDLDPISTSFGEVKYADGKKSVNIFGRFGSAIKAIAQAFLGKRKISGREDVLGETKSGAPSKYDKNEGDILFGSFVRGKMTPAAGLGYDALNGMQDYYTGEKIELSQLPNRLITPMSLEGLVKDLDKDGVGALFELPFKLSGLQMKDVRDYEEENRQFVKKIQNGQKLFDDYIKIKYAKNAEYEESPNKMFPKKAPDVISVDKEPKLLNSEQKKYWDELTERYSKIVLSEVLTDKVNLSSGKKYSQIQDNNEKIEAISFVNKAISKIVEEDFKKKYKEFEKADVEQTVEEVMKKMDKKLNEYDLSNFIIDKINEKKGIPNNQ